MRIRLEVEGGIERLCGELNVPYVSTGGVKPKERRDLAGGDGMHKGPVGQYWMGMQEGEALVAGWQAFTK